MEENKYDMFIDKLGEFVRVFVGAILVYSAILKAIEMGGILVPTIECFAWTFASFCVGAWFLKKNI